MKYTINRKVIIEQSITFETKVKLTEQTISELSNGDTDVFCIDGFGKYNEYNYTDDSEFYSLISITDEHNNILY